MPYSYILLLRNTVVVGYMPPKPYEILRLFLIKKTPNAVKSKSRFCILVIDVKGMGWDSWLFNLAWSLLFMGRVLFSGHNLHTPGWGDMKMKGQPNQDLNPVPPIQGSNHATNWANKADCWCLGRALLICIKIFVYFSNKQVLSSQLHSQLLHICD